MRASLKSVLAAGLLVGVLSATASADLIVQSVVDQSGQTYLQTVTGTPSVPPLPAGKLYDLATYDYTNPITAFSFDSTELPFPSTNLFPTLTYANLTGISQITVNLQALDPDSGPGEFAVNNLLLVLDGINTGLVLNSPNPTQGIVATLNVTGNPALATQLLAALQADGKLVAQVLDTSVAVPPTDPDFASGDLIGFPAQLQTSLDIQGAFQSNGPGPNPIPLPAAVFLAPLGAMVAGAYARKFRR